MDSTHKRAVLLIRTMMCYLEDTEPSDWARIRRVATEIEGREELKWANRLIKKDAEYVEERALEVLEELGEEIAQQTRLDYLSAIWREEMSKGYLTNKEAQWLLKVGYKWRLEQELLQVVDDAALLGRDDVS